MTKHKYQLIAEHRIEFLISVGMDPLDKDVWTAKWQSLRDRSKEKNRLCSLSFEDYVNLAKQAGISSPSQIGRTINSYQMARIGDKGDYEVGNCRFIPFSLNIQEKMLNGGTESQADKLRGKSPANHYAKSFRVTSPDGHIFEGSNLTGFCKEHNLNQGSMAAVCRGVDPHHKGWKGSYV